MGAGRHHCASVHARRRLGRRTTAPGPTCSSTHGGPRPGWDDRDGQGDGCCAARAAHAADNPDGCCACRPTGDECCTGRPTGGNLDARRGSPWPRPAPFHAARGIRARGWIHVSHEPLHRWASPGAAPSTSQCARLEHPRHAGTLDSKGALPAATCNTAHHSPSPVGLDTWHGPPTTTSRTGPRSLQAGGSSTPSTSPATRTRGRLRCSCPPSLRCCPGHSKGTTDGRRAASLHISANLQSAAGVPPEQSPPKGVPGVPAVHSPLTCWQPNLGSIEPSG